MTELACTLGVTDMARRADEIRALGRDGLLSIERRDGEALLRFRPDVRERVEAIVEAESRCCAFLEFALSDDVVLSIRAPEGGEAAVEMLVELFGADAARAWSRSQSRSS